MNQTSTYEVKRKIFTTPWIKFIAWKTNKFKKLEIWKGIELVLEM